MVLHHLSFVWGKSIAKAKMPGNLNHKLKYISSPLLAHQHLIKTPAITHWRSLRNTLQGTLVTHFSTNHCTPQEFCIWMDTAGTGLIKLPVWSFFCVSCEIQDGIFKSISLMGLWEVLKYTVILFACMLFWCKQRKLCKSFWYIDFQRNTHAVVAKTLQFIVW